MKCQSLLLIALSVFWLSLGATQHKMVVFIHGTIKPVEVSFSNMLRIINNKIDNSVYMHTADAIRNDPFFYQGQPMQQPGLHPITKDSPSPAALCFTHLYNKQYDFLEKNKTNRLYYTFGWHGLMNMRKRYEASEDLYKALQNELEQLAKKGIYPSIELYCYSYGGAVALNLGAVRDDNPALNPHAFTIDKLVLFGVPIQRSTDYLVSSPIFKNVYNIYSKEDSIQVMDVFSARQFFSKRRFSHRSEFKVPKKVKQIRIRLTKRLRGAHKIKVIPEKPYLLMASTKFRKKHTDAGHSELWNFKWGASWYRHYFAMEPMPVASLAPAFIAAIEEYTPTRQHVTLDYSKEYKGALITGRLKHIRKAVPILTPELTDELYALAYEYKPKSFTVEEQHEKTQNILQTIKDKMKNNSPFRRSRLFVSYLKSSIFPKSKKIRHTHLLSAKL